MGVAVNPKGNTVVVEGKEICILLSHSTQPSAVDAESPSAIFLFYQHYELSHAPPAGFTIPFSTDSALVSQPLLPLSVQSDVVANVWA